MALRFTKMQGLGNDFVVIDCINQNFDPTPETIQALADRHFGVGCDQVLLIETPKQPEIDFHYRIFNNDGSEVEHCGNGARCFARYVLDEKLIGGDTIRVSASNSIMQLKVQTSGLVTVDMGAPVLTPAEIPSTFTEQANSYSLETSAGTLEVGAVSMGNPHSVLVVDSVAKAHVDSLGPEIENHPCFPERVNAGFMEIVSKQEINLRVFERGAGETLACGTGACAAVVSGQLRGLLGQQVKVNLPGGSLSIEWQGVSKPVLMTGPATTVYQGKIKL